jgi:mannose-6-phosphate isomerase-like protein (cupin superfamily)
MGIPVNDRAFIIAGDQAAVIANDIDDARYRAAVHYVPVGVQVPVRCHGDAETQFMLDDGMLEFMVGGAATYVTAPETMRVPAGVPYAYRNVGDHTARLLVRASRPEPTYRMIRAYIEYAA